MIVHELPRLGADVERQLVGDLDQVHHTSRRALLREHVLPAEERSLAVADQELHEMTSHEPAVLVRGHELTVLVLVLHGQSPVFSGGFVPAAWVEQFNRYSWHARESGETSLAAQVLWEGSLVEAHDLPRLAGHADLAAREAGHRTLVGAQVELVVVVELVGPTEAAGGLGRLELVRGGPVMRRVLDHDLKDPLCDRRTCRSLGTTAVVMLGEGRAGNWVVRTARVKEHVRELAGALDEVEDLPDLLGRRLGRVVVDARVPAVPHARRAGQ